MILEFILIKGMLQYQPVTFETHRYLCKQWDCYHSCYLVKMTLSFQ